MGHPIGDAIAADMERRLGRAAVVVILLLSGSVCYAIKTRWESLRGAGQSSPVVAKTPQFDAHCQTCEQCGGGLLDENGQEQGLCEEGFRLWQDDLRRAMVK